MKLFFTKTDTLYKIIKSLEKVPKGRQLFLYIDNENSFFANPWRGKQVDTLLKEKGVSYVFVCKDAKAKKYFENLQLPYEYQAPNRILQSLHLFGMLLFNFKKFHLSVFTKKNTLSYIFIIGEILLIGAIIFVMYQFLVPSAKVLIQPAYTVEDVVYNFRYYQQETNIEWSRDSNYIAVPYQMGQMQYSQSMSIPIYSLQYLGKPSAWRIDIVNTLSTKFEMVKGTRFVNDAGLVFTADAPFVLQPGSRTEPSYTTISVTASDKDEHGEMIGNKGNIASWSRLIIRNLNQSAVLWNVYAVAIEDFWWGYSNSWGIVTQVDIDIMKEKLLSTVSGENKSLIVKKQFKNEDQFLLPLKDLITIQDVKYKINANSGDKIDVLNATIDVTYRYPYLIWNDLLQAIMEYLNQRPSQVRQLISLQKNTTIFYDTYNVGDTIIIPTKVIAVWWYNFNQDSNQLLPDIVDKIIWKTEEEARKVIIGYPEVSNVIFKISPAWSNTLPTLKSRISFSTTTPE